MSNSEQCREPNPSVVEYKFPWDSVPEDRTTPLHCQSPKNKNDIRIDPIESLSYIGTLLEAFLNDPDCIYRQGLKDYIQNDHISVNGMGFYDTSAQGEKPVVYIKYAGSKFQNNFAFDNSIGYNMENATETFYGRHVMGFLVYALSEQYTESLALIEEVRRFLHYFQLPIKRSLCWKTLEVVEMQAPAKDENFDCFTSTLSCTATFEESWSLTEAAPLLKKISLNVL